MREAVIKFHHAGIWSFYCYFTFLFYLQFENCYERIFSYVNLEDGIPVVNMKNSKWLLPGNRSICQNIHLYILNVSSLPSQSGTLRSSMTPTYINNSYINHLVKMYPSGQYVTIWRATNLGLPINRSQVRSPATSRDTLGLMLDSIFILCHQCISPHFYVGPLVYQSLA